MTELSYTVRLTGLRRPELLDRVAAYVSGRSTLGKDVVRGRLEHPPVLLLRGAARPLALANVTRLARLGARLSVLSHATGSLIQELPESGAGSTSDETLKLWLADALARGESVRLVVRASSRLRAAEYAAAGGLTSYLARQVLLVATDRRLLAYGLRGPGGDLRSVLHAVPYHRVERIKVKGGRLTLVGRDGASRSWEGLTEEASHELERLVGSAAAGEEGGGELVEALCSGCGAPGAVEEGIGCGRCGQQQLGARRAAARTLLIPGWSLARQGRMLAAGWVWAASLALILALSWWVLEARASGVATWAWAFPAAVWLVWAGSHALATWVRTRDEAGTGTPR